MREFLWHLPLRPCRTWSFHPFLHPIKKTSILLGDWLTMAFPLMADISNSAKAWWEESLMVAQEHYSRWLLWGIAMLLGALPDQLRRDLVSGRQLSVVHILYRLHVAYQPGGGAEKTQLLKNLVESKFSTSVGELLMQVRLWRRWLSRARELHLNLGPHSPHGRPAADD